jgi:hypothetical protein
MPWSSPTAWRIVLGSLHNATVGTLYRLAMLDKAKYPGIKTAGAGTLYYTNSSHLPVGYSDDVFEVLDRQDELQSLYTGGTVLHLYLGESIEDTRCRETPHPAGRHAVQAALSLPHAHIQHVPGPRIHSRRTLHLSMLRCRDRSLVAYHRSHLEHLCPGAARTLGRDCRKGRRECTFRTKG